jgi:ABC-type multidrug transport system fused ATPase/permease subunit
VDRGHIKETGRHEQLLQQQGIYYKLNMAQERRDNSEDNE